MQVLRSQLRGIFTKTELLPAFTFNTDVYRYFKHVATPTVGRFEQGKKPEYWTKKNEQEYPLQQPGEEPRKAYVCHCKEDIPLGWKNLWYIATFVQGMSVDEALKQLSFVPKKGAIYVKEAIQEAQELALKEHNVEYKSNLWISKSFPMTKEHVMRGIQRKSRRPPAKLKSPRSIYYLRLEEGSPPPNSKTPSGEEMLDAWLKRMRSRKITASL